MIRCIAGMLALALCQTPAAPVEPVAPPAPAGRLRLDLGTDTAHGRRLLRLLARDGITVAWADTGAGGEVTVRVELSVPRFTSIFRGTLVKRTVAGSSDQGSAAELFLDRYVIPKRYRGSLRWIRLPDPQLE